MSRTTTAGRGHTLRVCQLPTGNQRPVWGPRAALPPEAHTRQAPRHAARSSPASAADRNPAARDTAVEDHGAHPPLRWSAPGKAQSRRRQELSFVAQCRSRRLRLAHVSEVRQRHGLLVSDSRLSAHDPPFAFVLYRGSDELSEEVWLVANVAHAADRARVLRQASISSPDRCQGASSSMSASLTAPSQTRSYSCIRALGYIQAPVRAVGVKFEVPPSESQSCSAVRATRRRARSSGMSTTDLSARRSER